MIPMKKQAIHRREFIKTSAVVAAAFGMPTILPSRVLGRSGQVAPSNRIVVAGIGLGRRGRYVLRESFLKQPDVQFVAIADVQAEQRDIITRIVSQQYGNKDCYACRDMFEVLDRKDVDAVFIATGNRWHGLASMLAAKAGKDVYCEKPCAMSIQESLDLKLHVGASGQVFQAGMQRRNVGNYQFAVNLARSGRLGRLQAVHAGILFRSYHPLSLMAEREPDPEICDWDRWLGPAAHRSYNLQYLRAWKDVFDLAGGAGIPEWGSHTVDLCQWAAGADDTMPVRYESTGNTITGLYDSGVRLVMRTAGFNGEGDWRVKGTCPVRFEGDEGWVEADDLGELVASDEALLEGRPAGSSAGTNPWKHVREFLDCVRSREKPSANEHITCQSHLACHAAAIGWQLQRAVQIDPGTLDFVDDEEANRMKVWPYREPWMEKLKS